MLEFLPFWTAQKDWPRDQGGKVFLARALLRLGTEMHGSAWAGFEFAIMEDRPLSSPTPGSRFTVNTNAQAAAIHKTLTNAGHELLPAWPFPMRGTHADVKGRGYFWPDAKQIFEADQIETARVAAARALVAEQVRRRDAVADLFLRAVLADEPLPTYWQDPRNGSLDWNIPAANWNLPSRASFLLHCRINPTQPHEAKPGQWAGYIFVDGAALEQLVVAYRTEVARRARADWWPRSKEAVKDWIGRPDVQDEALSRIDPAKTKDAYVTALEAMRRETDADTIKPGTIGRTLRKYPEHLPASLA